MPQLIEREHGEQEEDAGGASDCCKPFDCACSGVVLESVSKAPEAAGGESTREGEREPEVHGWVGESLVLGVAPHR